MSIVGIWFSYSHTHVSAMLTYLQTVRDEDFCKAKKIVWNLPDPNEPGYDAQKVYKENEAAITLVANTYQMFATLVQEGELPVRFFFEEAAENVIIKHYEKLAKIIEWRRLPANSEKNYGKQFENLYRVLINGPNMFQRFTINMRKKRIGRMRDNRPNAKH